MREQAEPGGRRPARGPRDGAAARPRRRARQRGEPAVGPVGPVGPVGLVDAPEPATAARVDPALTGETSGEVGVVVQLHPDADGRPREAVAALGGSVTRELPVVDGFAATLPRAALHRLARVPGVAVVSADRVLQVQSGSWGPQSTSLAPRVLQAPAAWAEGITGRGVTVALLDTGVADVPDLAGRVVPVRDDRTGTTSTCYDLSGEGSCRDGFGHGTFMAGLVAGGGAGGGVRPARRRRRRSCRSRSPARTAPPTSAPCSRGCSGSCPSPTATTSASSTSPSAPTRSSPGRTTR
jgi:serine protease AprX